MRHSLILVLLGGLFLGVNLGWWPNVLSLLATWWPLILIALGLAGLIAPKTRSHCLRQHEGERS
ncbi:hypothetical protein HZU75_02720 [Chitinibacter fontanus]|uniref:LiaI-LiaF-like transmembrane region domain-containing protein n=1 Tax=Chitinibacter fontanus TaxID=1737446 RepID=A0A7D5V859_9NEIS|nr:DUF5668 domain-containing protein [Chitinibacter fontanus]QLI80536.1 hypothetical protein HZU75_02720 [Chitinibacter fontanus]